MEQLRVAFRMMRTGVSSGKDCGYFTAAISAVALRSSSAPERYDTSSTLEPFVKETTNCAVREFPWSLVWNGMFNVRISESQSAPCEAAASTLEPPWGSFRNVFKDSHSEANCL